MMTRNLRFAALLLLAGVFAAAPRRIFAALLRILRP